MRNARVWAGLLGIEHAVIERLEFDEDEELLVAHVRPSRTRRGRCGRCGRRCRGYDRGEGRRRWRALDLGAVRAVLEADAPRVSCWSTGWWSRRCRGRGTAPDTPARSTTPSPGDAHQLGHCGLGATAPPARRRCSSNARVCPAPCRAHGTAATTTPCSQQLTRGASASSTARTAPRSTRSPAPPTFTPVIAAAAPPAASTPATPGPRRAHVSDQQLLVLVELPAARSPRARFPAAQPIPSRCARRSPATLQF